MVEPYSERAREKMAALEAKEARGEKISIADLAGIMEPNPDLPDCQSRDFGTGVQCSLPNHHEGEHRAEVTW